MWFKQIKIFQLRQKIAYRPEEIATDLAALAFRPCPPSLPITSGWVAPLEQEGAPLVHAANGYMMICLNIEEKILPANVVRHHTLEKIKTIETEQDRKVRKKERDAIKDDVYQTLLPQAFSKFARIYAYIDTNQQQLIVNTSNAKKAELLINMLKKVLPECVVEVPELKKVSRIMAAWVQHAQAPSGLTIEQNGVLQDPNNQSRIIRCQQQNLTANGILSLLKEGCEVSQLALNWNEQINFKLKDDFSLVGVRFQDEVLELAKENYTETKAQQFDTDFMIMTETLAQLISELLALCTKPNSKTAEATTRASEPESIAV